MALTGQDVLTQLNKITLPQMLTGIGVTVAAITAAVFFLEIQPTMEEITRRHALQGAVSSRAMARPAAE